MPKPKREVKNGADSDDTGEEEIQTQGAQALSQGNIDFTHPGLLAAVQSKLAGLVGTQSGYIDSLPQSIKNRINALKNLQVEFVKLEGKFYEEVHNLEVKYADLYNNIYEKRKTVVVGDYEPTEEECKWVEPEDDSDEEGEEGEEKDDHAKEEKVEEKKDTAGSEDKKEGEKTEGDKEPIFPEDTKGIPEFWLTAMKSIDLISDMIQPHDEPILKSLTDIRVKFSSKSEQVPEDKSQDGMGFMLEFHFAENDFFTQKVLTKSYKLKAEPDEEDPFAFDGPEIIGCSGCKIDWKKGKNVTVKTVKKKQKHKGKGTSRVVTKTVKNDSFFNFFDPPEVSVDDEEMDEETEGVLGADFEIGHFFRERLIPRAVLYFTGEALDDNEEYNDEEDDGELGDDDDDEDEDNDPDFQPGDDKKPADCKQQ